MCNEVGCVDYFEDRDFGSIYSPSPEPSYKFHTSIFEKHNKTLVLAKAVTFSKAPKEVEQRTQQAAKIAPMSATVSAKGELTFEWGGKEGTSVSGSVSGGVSDSKGNRADLKVERAARRNLGSSGPSQASYSTICGKELATHYRSGESSSFQEGVLQIDKDGSGKATISAEHEKKTGS